MSTIIHKKSSVAAKVPLAADLQFGELAINYEDEKLYFKNSAGQVKSWSRNNDVYAKATEAILKGQLVMFAGAQGDHILVSKADLSAVGFIDTWIVGVANQNFAQNDFGDITWFGTVEGIDTSIWPIGTILYASTTVGGLTATKPTQPSHIIQIAAVTNSHATQGSLIVRPTFGMHLGELHDVYAPSPASGDTIIWNATTNRWETGTGSATDATKLPLAGGTMTGAITFAAAQTWPTFNQNTTGNAATATALQTARTINGVSFNGTANITVADSTKLPLAGGTITGNLAVNGNTTLGDAGTDTVTIKGNLGFGSGPSTNTGIYYRSTAAAMTGSTSGYGIYMDVPFDSGVTVAAEAGRFRVNTAAATYTVTEVSALRLADALKGAGSTITNQYGLSIADLTSGTNNYGILSLVSSGSNKWNIYASGTAANYFAGKTTFGHTNTTNTGQINVLGTVRVVDNATETNALLTTVTNTTSTIETRYSTPLVLGSNATERLRLGTTESVFNEPGGDYDFRVESGTNTHAIFLDAGNSRVGINNSTPTVALDITGDLKASGELVISSVGKIGRAHV